MKITKEQFSKIEHLMPKQRKKSTTSNYNFVCAMLYIIENGCKWRALLKEFGDWHTIYVRFNRWSKNGTIDRIFQELQNKNIIDIRTEIVCKTERRFGLVGDYYLEQDIDFKWNEIDERTGRRRI